MSSTVRVTSYAKRFSEVLAAEFKRRTKRAAEVLATELKRNLSSAGRGTPSAPGQFPRLQSGALLRGVRVRVSKESPYTVRITNKAPHADFIELGTKGGTVFGPVRAKALRFVPRGAGGLAGKPIFVKRVKHGLIKAREPMRRTARENRDKIRRIFTRGVPELKGGSNKAVVRIS